MSAVQKNAASRGQTFLWHKLIHSLFNSHIFMQFEMTSDLIYAARFLDAWKRAKEQDGSFILPKNIFSNVYDGSQLKQQLVRITPVVWAVECGRFTSIEKHRVRHAYRRLCQEAYVLSFCEKQLKKFNITKKPPEPSASLIGTIAKLKLLEHPTIQKTLALSSELHSGRRYKKHTQHNKNVQTRIKSDKETNVVSLSASRDESQKSLDEILPVHRNNDESLFCVPLKNRLHELQWSSCKVHDITAIPWESGYNLT